MYPEEKGLEKGLSAAAPPACINTVRMKKIQMRKILVCDKKKVRSSLIFATAI